MTATELIDVLRQHDIHIMPRGDGLRVVAAQGKLPPRIKQELRLNKKDLLALLTPSLSEYIAVLDEFEPEGPSDLPPAPPFESRPERPVAWSAWWDAVECLRKRLR